MRSSAAVSVDAAAIIKVGRNLSKVRRVLEQAQLLHCATYVERATMPNQLIVPLSGLDAPDAPYFSMILVHRRGLAWD